MPQSTCPERILIVRPSALGDVARTVPALVSIRRAWPDAQIDWLVNDHMADAVRHHPAVTEVIPFARERFGRVYRSWGAVRELLGLVGRLRRQRYDVVYDLQGLIRSGVLTAATRARRRVGAVDAGELAWMFYNCRHRIGPTPHTVDRMLAVLEADGIDPVRDMRLYVGEADRAWADDWLAKHGLVDAPYAVLAPTAKWLSKCWPAERFARIAQRLADLNMRDAVVVGAPGERDQVDAMLASAAPPPGSVRLRDLAGQTTVGQLMAILQTCSLLVCNDSGALHLALGLGRRAVGIFGPTDVDKVGPYRYDIGAVCAANHRKQHYRAAKTDQRIIAGIDTEQVWQAIQRVMSQPPPQVCAEVPSNQQAAAGGP